MASSALVWLLEFDVLAGREISGGKNLRCLAGVDCVFNSDWIDFDKRPEVEIVVSCFVRDGRRVGNHVLAIPKKAIDAIPGLVAANAIWLGGTQFEAAFCEELFHARAKARCALGRWDGHRSGES